jgi:hypothetical protein
VRDVGVNTIPPAATPSLGTRTDRRSAGAALTRDDIDDRVHRPLGGMTFYNAGTPQEGRYGTVLFSDIRNFLTLAVYGRSRGGAECLLRARCDDPAARRLIAKLLGDGVLAMFEPTARNVADHELRAPPCFTSSGTAPTPATRRFRTAGCPTSRLASACIPVTWWWCGSIPGRVWTPPSSATP